MNYEQKYKEALEKLRAFHRDYKNISHLVDVKEELESIFPELKESVDEKIRRCTQVALTDVDEKRFNDRDTTLKDCLTWLEKQGEQKSADKIEPKFKVGDTIIGPCNNIFQVKKVLDKQYLLHSENGDELNSIEIVDKYSCLEEPASGDLTFETESKNPNCSPMLYGAIDYSKREVIVKELESLYNKLGIDNELSTPDYLLAEYTLNCLIVYGNTIGINKEKGYIKSTFDD